MKYQCCAIHDMIDRNIELLRQQATDPNQPDEARAWARDKLLHEIDRQMIGVENPDGTFHVRKSSLAK